MLSVQLVAQAQDAAFPTDGAAMPPKDKGMEQRFQGDSLLPALSLTLNWSVCFPYNNLHRLYLASAIVPPSCISSIAGPWLCSWGCCSSTLPPALGVLALPAQPLSPRAAGATCVTWPQWHRAQCLFRSVTKTAASWGTHRTSCSTQLALV